MATYTENYNLEKPIGSENYNIEIFNANSDIIDATLKQNADAIESVEDIAEGAASAATSAGALAALHASRHTSGGEDPITPAAIGAAPAANVTKLEAANTVLTTSGTAPNFTVADASVTAYAAGLRRTIKFDADGSDVTLNFNGLGAKNLYEYTGKAAKVKAGQHVTVLYDGTSFFTVSGGGGIALPGDMVPGETVVFQMFGTELLASQASYRDIPGYSATILRSGTYRVSFIMSKQSGTNGNTARGRLALNGDIVPDSEISIAPLTRASTKKTMDLSLAAGDVIKLQGQMNGGEGSGWTAFFPGLSISILAEDLQAALDEIAIVTGS